VVVVEARMLGRKQPLVPRWSVPVPIEPTGGDGNELTLRDLITRIVRAEVRAFRERQDARRFVRVLSEREIERGRQRGRIDAGGSDLEQHVDPEVAVATALQGFLDGLYLVLLDDAEQRELDQRIHVTESSRVVFLRLTFLAGA